MISTRKLSTYPKLFRVITPEGLKSKTKNASSQHWLSRQLSDPYVEKARMLNYRCRSAFKLIEIDDKYKILQPGHVVLDVGASPGSWTQVIVQRNNSNGSSKDLPTGISVAIDKQQIYPIDGATILGNMDFTDPISQKLLLDHLGGRKADAIVSDMAPSATGMRQLDTENIIKLCYSVLRFALQVSKPDGSLLVKLWQCHELKKLELDMALFYGNVKIVKPQSSRSDSAEIFLLGRRFKGAKPIQQGTAPK
ncbi:unnamed protein product [Phaedon cochleariae]|uniref:rRNA methyltransferase 2, mitochondrial n=1 Tax=Phaedon cochleariae TaxID=80249 RepID=A0A9P0DV40_PHACE|nr:unnamed protein product [Phaedon cochleariae]